jgi:hypothetical protein
MQPTEARDIGDALDDRPVPAVWARPAHVGNEKYLAGFWIIEASDLDVALKLATEVSKASMILQSEGLGRSRCGATLRRAAGRAYGRRRFPAVASTSRIAHHRGTQKVLKDIRAAVSDRGRGVRSRGERPPTRGTPNHRR